jgi:hypothetical protein
VHITDLLSIQNKQFGNHKASSAQMSSRLRCWNSEKEGHDSTVWFEPDGYRLERASGSGGILARRQELAMQIKRITLPGDLYERVEQEAQGEGKTVDEVAAEAVKRELARRWLERTRREAEIRRGSMTDGEVEASVDTAVQEWRREQHGR